MNTESVNLLTTSISDASTEDALRMINDADAAVAAIVAGCIPQITRLVDAAVNTVKNGGRIIYCGCGTSGRLAVADAAECPPTYGVSSELIRAVIAGGEKAITHASEGCEDNRERGIEAFDEIGCRSGDMVIGISAAGRAPFVLAFIEKAKDSGCVVGAITNNVNTPMAAIADIAVEALTGAEVIKGSTRMKAGSSQKMILNMFSTAVFIKLGCTYRNYMVNMTPTNDKLRERAVSMLSDITGLDKDSAKEILIKNYWNIRAALKQYDNKDNDSTAGVIQ